MQIQRTHSGLGAAAEELMDGTFAHLQILHIDPSIYQRHPPARTYRTMVEMRVDAAGHMIRIPMWMHRPLPENGRIKQARLVWRKEGGRLRYYLCLMVNLPKVERVHPSEHTTFVRVVPRIDWRPSDSHPDHPRAHIVVADISGSDGHTDKLILPEDWVREMDRVDHLPSVIDDETLPERLRRYWARQRPGLWRRLLLRRREIYRLFARDIAARYGKIVIETPPLAVQAFVDRGKQQNTVRHRACAHQLISELKHQAGKSGAVIETVIAAPTASAAVPLRIRGRKNNGLQNHDAQKTAALANSAAGP